MHARVGVDQGKKGGVGMCAFELMSEAQSRAVDDMTSHKECSTQHIKESGFDTHGRYGIPSVAFCRDVQVWTGA